MSIFVQAQGIKTVHAGSGGQTMAKLNAPIQGHIFQLMMQMLLFS